MRPCLIVAPYSADDDLSCATSEHIPLQVPCLPDTWLLSCQLDVDNAIWESEMTATGNAQLVQGTYDAGEPETVVHGDGVRQAQISRSGPLSISDDKSFHVR